MNLRENVPKLKVVALAEAFPSVASACNRRRLSFPLLRNEEDGNGALEKEGAGARERGITCIDREAEIVLATNPSAIWKRRKCIKIKSITIPVCAIIIFFNFSPPRSSPIILWKETCKRLLVLFSYYLCCLLSTNNTYSMHKMHDIFYAHHQPTEFFFILLNCVKLLSIRPRR